ncbi:hypothetical protein AQUCO_08700002v1 [Aquilegia coerulea]|uniref:Uncharacterized protein n=1 Tax=Aquilegia coerulea TaxID=218851 RepID=A0A2G5C695_AQUCA|nr:hypothetical protein AQUCO_08700002v1 [Aquilegia coerulea]
MYSRKELCSKSYIHILMVISYNFVHSVFLKLLFMRSLRTSSLAFRAIDVHVCVCATDCCLFFLLKL